MPKAEDLVKKLRNYFEVTGLDSAVVGLSGGVDSALTAKLGVMAIGAGNVTALLMPNDGVSSVHSVDDSEHLARELGIKYHIIPIQDYVNRYRQLPWNESETASMNIQARVRATILYHYANSNNALVLGTGNKTEKILGYFTKYGDGAVDVLPIGSMYKTDVWEMAKELGLPATIVSKTPSAELRPDHTDEDEIGMTYEKMDEILKKPENGNKENTDDEKKLITRIQTNEHKNSVPPVI